ncbi:MAG TPA: hypothetical protein PK583_00150 [Gammaproteobacteria bacterium]|nr:hypothetical protein [Gammaproteobacteria bacterium]
MTITETWELLGKIKAAWSTFRVSETSVAEWHEALVNFPYSVILDAYREVRNESRFAPAISDIMAKLVSHGVMAQKEEPLSEHQRQVLKTMKRKNRAIASADWHNYITPQGQIRSKIEYCMDILGPETVTQELKAIKGTNQFSDLCGSAGWVPLYKEKLEEMFETAKNFEAYPIE